MAKKPTIGITIGDPLGIGPEIIARALNMPEIYEYCTPKIIGDVEILKLASAFLKNKNDLGINKKLSELKPIDAAKIAIDAIDEAVNLAQKNEIDAIVTAPVNKARLRLIKASFEGHTEYLADKANIPHKDVYMLFGCPLGDKCIVVDLVTRHIPLNKVAASIDTEKVLQSIKITNEFIKKYFKRHPKLAVLGLNPHAGEEETIGTEDSQIILPAIKKAAQLGIDVEGPFAADTSFIPAFIDKFDGWVAQYHDQGLIPIKTLNFLESVNITMGLPFLRTSVSHGTAEDIAWKGIADETNFIATIKLTSEMLHNKRNRINAD